MPRAESRSHGGGGAGALLMLSGGGAAATAAADAATNGNGNPSANGNGRRKSQDDSAVPSSSSTKPRPKLTRGVSLFFDLVTEEDDKLRDEKMRRSMEDDDPRPPGLPVPVPRAAALPPRPPSMQRAGSGQLASGASPLRPGGGSSGGGSGTLAAGAGATQQQPNLPPRLPPSASLAAAAAAAASRSKLQLPSMTPAEVLHELLGDLFIAPTRLVEHELLGEGGFAAVHAATLAPPGSDGGGGAGGNGSADINPLLAAFAGPEDHDDDGLYSALGEPVAVKRLLPDALAGPEDLKEFLAEANLLRKMRHPHVVALRGVGSRDLDDFVSMRRSMYVVQERMDAGDLRALVAAQAAHPFRRVYARADALRWARQVAAAVLYLHGVCRPMVIHRDLKLDNVLLATPDRGLVTAPNGGGAAAVANNGGGGGAAARAAEAAKGGEPVTGEWTAKLADFGLHKRLRRRARAGGSVRAGGGAMLSATNDEGGEGEWVAWDSYGPSYRGADYEPSFYGANLYFSASVHGAASAPLTAQQQQQQAVAAAANRRMAAERALAGSDASGGGGDRSLDASTRDTSVRRRAEALRAIDDGSVHGGSRGKLSPEIAVAALSASVAAQAAGGSGKGGGGGAAPVDATTRVGSLLYMAPEVLHGEPYNEKVDVFSFGVMLFELFSGKPLANRVAAAAEAAAAAGSSDGGGGGGKNKKTPAPTLMVRAGGGEDDEEQGTLLAYAQRVANGHREDLPEAWPRELRELISACWAADPAARPSFGQIVRRLDALRSSGAIEAMDAALQKGLRTDYDPVNDCGCGCAIM
jgi:serine/threonine protein kinase